ncbi:MAG: NeuD/PglB/VioB family sugar acetyltransferase, partial [Clostridia bacterium]|nr:NeuD/PglB/VioB family sugar acetyltransferase [Clostridia bacterium]
KGTERIFGKVLVTGGIQNIDFVIFVLKSHYRCCHRSYTDHDFIVAIGNNVVRRKVQHRLTEQGLRVVSLVHPHAVIAEDVQIGSGTVVMAGAVVNPAGAIGRGCIINTGATVDHDNVIEDFVHISVGSHLAGTVCVGTETMVGAGAVVSNNVKICGGCMIGAGAVVVRDIQEAGTYVGVPARKIR